MDVLSNQELMKLISDEELDVYIDRQKRRKEYIRNVEEVKHLFIIKPFWVKKSKLINITRYLHQKSY